MRQRNVASFLLALSVLYLVYRAGLGLDWREAWGSERLAVGACLRRLLRLVPLAAHVLDTELLLLAEERGLRLSEVPMDWIEDLDSRVDPRPP